jgi:RimJ/RimL family protein N-acetyltransferase
MRHRIVWGDLVAFEPTPDEVAAAAPALAAAYSDAHNAPLMGHTAPLEPADVIDHYADLADEGARAFLLHDRGVLAGDGDLRDIDDGAAELAILIAARAAQGKGLGTRFAIMLHAFAFRVLGLTRVYVAIVPANAASLRLFARLGYQPDDSPAARDYADEPSDLTFSLERAAFEQRHAAELSAIEITPRD